MSTQPSSESKPYKGPLSYEIEDREYFFGRDHEAALLTARILSSRFTLLHAQSGTGKTSLLNARVIPALEEQGWTVFRILPRHNPSEAVRMGVLLGLLPHPAAECAVLERVVEQFSRPGEDPQLHEVLRRFDTTRQPPEEARQPRRSDPRRRDMLLPVPSSIDLKWAAFSFSGLVRPLFLRLLRATLEISQYAEHLSAVLPRAPQPLIHEGTRTSELRRVLNDPATAAAHEELLGGLYAPVPSLREFFTNLLGNYGKRRTQFELVLILDQFEELFTLFSDSLAAPQKQLWRLRWDFIDQLEDLYRAGSALPIRYVISMRDEYIAQLDPLRRFVRDLDASAFHLSFLEKDAARAAIQKPAKLFGYDYSEECYQNIFDVLVREDRFVEPAPLQIVCDRLWQEQGKSLSVAGGDQTRLIEYTSFPKGGTQAILDAFFDDTLNALANPEVRPGARAEDRLEALEMLEPLVTPSRTRNIVERGFLVNQPFRRAQLRSELLDNLADQRIVRIEQRLGGQFVEITHEFLIGPILDKIRTVLNADPEYGHFRWAIRTLERYEDIDFRRDSRHVLDARVYKDLNAKREQIEWNDWAVELMLRSAIVAGADKDAVRDWAERYRRSGSEPDVGTILSEDRIHDPARSLLTLGELYILNAYDTQGLNAEQVEFVLRSQIQRAGDLDREQIVRWTEELKRLCQAEIPS